MFEFFIAFGDKNGGFECFIADYPRTSPYTCVVSPVGTMHKFVHFLAIVRSGRKVFTTGDVPG